MRLKPTIFIEADAPSFTFRYKDRTLALATEDVQVDGGIVNVFGWFRRRRPLAQERVAVTDEGIIRTRPDGVTETVRWEDLTEVGIITTDEGPFVEDVFWIFVEADERSGCAVAQSAEGNETLLARLQQLPGFDNEAVIQAMGSTTNARFTCWKRPGV